MATAMPTMPKLLPLRDGFRDGQAAQRQDEQDGGDEVAERGEAADIGAVLSLLLA